MPTHQLTWLVHLVNLYMISVVWYVYSPPQDNKDKRLRVDLLPKEEMRVSAKAFGSAEMRPLIEVNGSQPSLSAVRDARGLMFGMLWFDLPSEAKLAAT